ncbi:HK97-gp10 family putative phage morphogenesis protein [Streptomyces sp. 135]|uniref:HK97-gp10 family putative phage morphogenesis protein n=1 Tax=Streptomyces sp. 135 TaxID=2838850 RepID=UPI001CBC8949|nr:HK97-gp10 family putative phage morphogenesis protein [Streptomyces sp. 135]
MASAVSGLQTALRRLRELPLRMNRARNQALEEWAGAIEATAKDLAPKRTGRLEGSIEARTNASTGKAWVTVDPSLRLEYPYYVEKGTSKMEAQPFLGPAAQLHRRTGERAVRAAASRLLRRW